MGSYKKTGFPTLDLKQTYSEKILENDYQVLTAMYSRDDRDLFYPSQLQTSVSFLFNPHYRRYSRNVNRHRYFDFTLFILLFQDRFFRGAETLD